jgi:hypothetical protein
LTCWSSNCGFATCGTSVQCVLPGWCES